MSSSDDDSTVTTTLTRFRTTVISKPTTTTTETTATIHPSSTSLVQAAPNTSSAPPLPNKTLGVDILPQIPCAHGVPCTTKGPSRATVGFWAFIMVVLMIILLGYIVFTIYLFAREIPKGRAQKREKARRAAQAAKDAIAMGLPNVKKERREVRVIDTRDKIRRDRPRDRNHDRLRNEGRDGESYEMDDLHSSRGRHGSPHVRWGEERGRSSSRDANEQAQARIWNRLTVGNIEDVDDGTRIAALQQMRNMQEPVQTNLGDDGVWSPITTTEDLREMYRSRRQPR